MLAPKLGLLFALLWGAVSASADTVPFTGTYTGTFSLVGMSGTDLLFQSVQTSIDSSLGLTGLANAWAVTPGTPNIIHNGVATFSAPDGNTLLAMFSGTAVPMTGFQLATVQVTFIGGTGRFKGATGAAVVSAQLFDNGVATGTINGSVHLVPELSSLLLLGTGLAGLVPVIRRKFRK